MADRRIVIWTGLFLTCDTVDDRQENVVVVVVCTARPAQHLTASVVKSTLRDAAYTRTSV